MENDLLAITSAQIMELYLCGAHKELIVLNISKYEYCVNKSRDMSLDHFA